MTPLDLLAWAVSISITVFLMSIAIVTVVGAIRALQKPKKSSYTAPVAKLKLVKEPTE